MAYNKSLWKQLVYNLAKHVKLVHVLTFDFLWMNLKKKQSQKRLIHIPGYLLTSYLFNNLLILKIWILQNKTRCENVYLCIFRFKQSAFKANCDSDIL